MATDQMLILLYLVAKATKQTITIEYHSLIKEFRMPDQKGIATITVICIPNTISHHTSNRNCRMSYNMTIIIIIF